MKLIWHNLLWYLVFVSRLMLDWWIHIFRHYIVFQNRQVSEAKGHSFTSVDWSRHHCAKRVKAICRLNLCQLHFYGLKLTQAFKTLFQYYWIKDLSFREKKFFQPWSSILAIMLFIKVWDTSTCPQYCDNTLK